MARTTQVTAAELASIRQRERRRVLDLVSDHIRSAATVYFDAEALIAQIESDPAIDARLSLSVAQLDTLAGMLDVRARIEEGVEIDFRHALAAAVSPELYEDAGLPHDGPSVEGDQEYADILRRQGIR